MAKELTEAQKARRLIVRRGAKKAAKAAGKDWATLPKEERKDFRKQARKAQGKKKEA